MKFLAGMAGFWMAVVPSASLAACPQQLAVYKAANGNLLEFSGNSSADFHQIGLLLQTHDEQTPPIILDAFVEKTHGLGQAEMTVRYGCPDGDIPLDDLDDCTIYQSVIYGADSNGLISELPATGKPAAESIVLPNFTADVWMHAAWKETGGPKRPAEVFQLSGCME